MSKPNHYVDNVAFHVALVKRKELVDSILIKKGFIDSETLSTIDHEQRKRVIDQFIEDGNTLPQITNEIGDIFLKMANNIPHKYNFNRYPFKEEMIGDGIIDCIKYVDSFDVTRTNPFAYFTQAINNAFIRRIVKERKQVYIKSQILSNMNVDIHELQEHDEDGEFTNAFKEYMSAYNNFDGSMFEKKKKEKTESYNGTTIEEFYDKYKQVESSGEEQ